MNQWFKANAALIAATSLLLATFTLTSTFMRWELTNSIASIRNELTARIETSEAKMNTARVEILAKLDLLQKQFDTLQRQIEGYLSKNIDLEVQTKDNTRRIDSLENRLEMSAPKKSTPR